MPQKLTKNNLGMWLRREIASRERRYKFDIQNTRWEEIQNQPPEVIQAFSEWRSFISVYREFGLDQ